MLPSRSNGNDRNNARPPRRSSPSLSRSPSPDRSNVVENQHEEIIEDDANDVPQQPPRLMTLATVQMIAVQVGLPQAIDETDMTKIVAAVLGHTGYTDINLLRDEVAKQVLMSPPPSSSSSSSSGSRRYSRSPSPARHRRSRSRSQSRSRSRSHRHSRRYARSFSSDSEDDHRRRRRSSSRSRSRDRDRRTRSPSPLPLLSQPDVLAPHYKKLSSTHVKTLLEGKNVHIDSLVRQKQSSAVDEKIVAEVGSLTISSSATRARRSVTEPLVWFEAFLSSVMPAHIRRASEATTLDECKHRLESVERFTNYLLAATTYFRDYNFLSAKNYLESHREHCMNSGSPSNIAVPNTLSISQLVANTSTQQSSSSSASKPSDRKQHRPAKRDTDDNCGAFNSYKGCSFNSCKYKHVCRICGSSDHGKTSCSDFAKKAVKRK